MRVLQSQNRLSSMLQAVVVLFIALSVVFPSLALAQTEAGTIAYEEDGVLGHELLLPVYHWWQPGTTPRGVVFAVHGLTMHGRSYDALGKTLAADGFAVYSMDLRGYGRTVDSDHRYCSSAGDCKEKIDYEKSFEDMKRLARCLREKYASLPIFAVGESLGGSMVIRLAAKNPELVDGLVLSAPAVKRHNFIDPYMISTGAMVAVNPRTQLDLMPFVRKFCSDDPNVIAEKENDPLLRRHLSAYEIMQSGLAVHKTVSYISEIPSNMPILVIQGSADRCIKANSVMWLLAHSRSADQTVKWFPERGHILLETSYVKPDTMDAVVSWLTTHVNAPMVQAKCNNMRDIIASESWHPGMGVNVSVRNVAIVGLR